MRAGTHGRTHLIQVKVRALKQVVCDVGELRGRCIRVVTCFTQLGTSDCTSRLAVTHRQPSRLARQRNQHVFQPPCLRLHTLLASIVGMERDVGIRRRVPRGDLQAICQSSPATNHAQTHTTSKPQVHRSRQTAHSVW